MIAAFIIYTITLTFKVLKWLICTTIQSVESSNSQADGFIADAVFCSSDNNFLLQ